MTIIPSIGLAKFKLHPTRTASQNEVTCVLSHNNAVFYTVTPERMKELLDAEKKLKELGNPSVPDGFVLVSREIPDSVVDRLENSSYHWGDGTRAYFTPIYQMMIESQEPSDEHL